jgi:hypothetical protein
MRTLKAGVIYFLLVFAVRWILAGCGKMQRLEEFVEFV